MTTHATHATTSATRSASEYHACPSARIAGFVSTGMIDWPGLVTSTLFLSGCPLHCPYCHNADLLVAHSAPGTWDKVLTHLSLRRGWIDGVVVSGGEPTADPDIFALLELFAARGLRVKLDTNGVAPDVLSDILRSGLVDYVALDVKTFPHRYHLVGSRTGGEAVRESIEIVRASGIAHEFRTTVYPPLIAPSELPELARLLSGGDLYALQQFRPEHTLTACARDVQPASRLDLLAAARSCSESLPTITRGA